MNTWNDDYNMTPRNGYNSGYGAEEFRLLKTNISDRLSSEHIFGQDETTYSTAGGVHKEGSAKVFVKDQNTSTDRIGKQVTAIGDVGQIFSEFTSRASDSYLQLNEVTQDSNLAKFFHKVYINGYALSTDTVTTKELFYDYDFLVNTQYDQKGTLAINGLKEFLYAPMVPIEDRTWSYNKTATPDVLTDIKGKAAVAFEDLRGVIHNAQFFNFLDGNDDLNEGVLGNDGRKHTVDIYPDVVYANAVYGAVWG